MSDAFLSFIGSILWGGIYICFLIMPFYLIAAFIYAFWKDHFSKNKETNRSL